MPSNCLAFLSKGGQLLSFGFYFILFLLHFWGVGGGGCLDNVGKYRGKGMTHRYVESSEWEGCIPCVFVSAFK